MKNLIVFIFLGITLKISGQTISGTDHKYWPHKKTIGVDINYIVGSDLIGGNISGIIKSEDDFLTNLGLVWQETQNGQTTNTPIDEYDYVEGVYFGGLRISYYLGNKFSAGLNFRFYNYSQKLSIDKDDGEGDLIKINFLGPSFSYIIFKKNRIGISIKSDISYAFGNIETIPALADLNEKDLFKDLTGYPALLESNNISTSISGVQANAGISIDYFIARWFYIDAGIHLSYFSCSTKEELWTSSSKDYNSTNLTFYMGLNILLWNRLDE